MIGTDPTQRPIESAGLFTTNRLFAYAACGSYLLIMRLEGRSALVIVTDFGAVTTPQLAVPVPVL